VCVDAIRVFEVSKTLEIETPESSRSRWWISEWYFPRLQPTGSLAKFS